MDRSRITPPTRSRISHGAGHWTVERVERRVTEAVDTLKRLPTPSVRRRVTLWPEFVRDSREAYGWETARPRLAPAAPEAITHLDETLAWLRWLPRLSQRILWSRASGLSWRRIAHAAGKSPNTCRARYLAALHRIAVHLNEGRPEATLALPVGRGANNEKSD